MGMGYSGFAARGAFSKRAEPTRCFQVVTLSFDDCQMCGLVGEVSKHLFLNSMFD